MPGTLPKNKQPMRVSFQDLIASETPVLIDFFATWCGPCRMVSPILEDLKKDLGEGVQIYKIDVDQNPGLAQNYQVQSVPTLMVFQNGELKWRASGVQSKAALKHVIGAL
jgi:thioredoxin 1